MSFVTLLYKKYTKMTQMAQCHTNSMIILKFFYCSKCHKWHNVTHIYIIYKYFFIFPFYYLYFLYLSEVGVKLAQSWCKVGAKLVQSWCKFRVKKNSTYYMNMWNLIIITWNKSIISSEQDTSLMAVLACFSCSKIYL